MLAAAMNHPRFPVHRKAQGAVFATGDELKAPGSPPGPGEIVYSTALPFSPSHANEGCEVIDLGIVPDQVEDISDPPGAGGQRRWTCW